MVVTNWLWPIDCDQLGYDQMSVQRLLQYCPLPLLQMKIDDFYWFDYEFTFKISENEIPTSKQKAVQDLF